MCFLTSDGKVQKYKRLYSCYVHKLYYYHTISKYHSLDAKLQFTKNKQQQQNLQNKLTGFRLFVRLWILGTKGVTCKWLVTGKYWAQFVFLFISNKVKKKSAKIVTQKKRRKK